MSDTMQAYCMKCRTKRDITEPEAVYTKSGAPGTRGICPECGTKLFLMGETPAHANVPKPEVIVKPKRKASSKKKKKTTRKKKVGKLVIVESPSKAKTVGNFLGKGYTVKASKGHVRDLLKSRLSVDVENEFEPEYRVLNDKRATVKELKADVAGAEEIYLATDPDREGEAIAWHLIEATDMPADKIRRVVFHEITDTAVEHAFENPREIDMNLVNAQQARRILDRLVGYPLTELLWSKVQNYISAGRVQSIALRMVVEREREIEAFVPVEYWSIEAEVAKKQGNGKKPKHFIARLVKINGEDFDLNTEDEVKPHLAILEKSLYLVDMVKKGTRKRRPSAPFTTSTLQQEASRRLGFDAGRTMRAAQKLYEGITLDDGKSVGLITYMRTDSVTVSDDARNEARAYVTETFGADFIPEKPPVYKTKSKSAQEAHEAVRPTSVMRHPAELQAALLAAGKATKSGKDLYRLYRLIWERFVASQMSNAIYNTIRVEIKAGENRNDMPYLLRSSGSNIKFKGFLALYEDTRDEDATDDSDEGRILPEMDADELLDLLKLLPEQHFTQPPPRYTEASLVRTLEEYGIGRPSTYASIMNVIQNRGYVDKTSKRLFASETGKKVIDLLVEYFPETMNYEFTARMESQLDEIADNDGIWRPMLSEFYQPFDQRIKHAHEVIPDKTDEKVGRICPTCEEGDLVIKYGRYGKFIGCNRHPECNHTEPFLEYAGMLCPVCGGEHEGQVVVRKSKRRRTFYGCSRYPDCDFISDKLPGEDDAADNNDADTKQPAAESEELLKESAG